MPRSPPLKKDSPERAVAQQLERRRLKRVVKTEALQDAIFKSANFSTIATFWFELTTAVIPMLATSANAMAGDIKRGLAAGFIRYLTKPINVVDFMQAIDEVLKTRDIHVNQAGEVSAS